jgi:deoxyribonuclease V
LGLGPGTSWPASWDGLEKLQLDLASASSGATRWNFGSARELRLGAAFIAYRRGVYGVGAAGDKAWAAAVEYQDGQRVAVQRLAGTVGAPYIPGYLALREGPMLERVVRQLLPRPDVVMFDSTGRDHPRRAGLALHLGAVLDLPTLGVSDRPLLAGFDLPGPKRGDKAPLMLGEEVVGYAVRTQDNVKPVLVHAGWRTDPETAAEVVLAMSRVRTPEPLREARRLAKEFREEESRHSIVGVSS